MPFAEGDAVILLKQSNGRLIAENARVRAERKELWDWVCWFLVEELEVNYADLDHVIGCRKCFVNWTDRNIYLCEEGKS